MVGLWVADSWKNLKVPLRNLLFIHNKLPQAQVGHKSRIVHVTDLVVTFSGYSNLLLLLVLKRFIKHDFASVAN